MSEAIFDALGPVLARWTVGGGAASAAPPAWRDALDAEAGEAELRLLALSGQFLGTMALTEPAGELRIRPDVPALPHPPLAEALRPRARRLLQQLREPWQRRDLLDFLDGRGWTMHPADWMPQPNEAVPDIYAAWQDWATADDCAPSDDTATVTLTAASWDRFGPAARRAAFNDLRRRDPAQAVALLAEKIGGEDADARVRWLEVLGKGLCDADRPLLDELAADRAPRVRALVGSLLARLGHSEPAADDLAELAGFFTVETKDLSQRTYTIVPRALKTPAQNRRRADLLLTLPFDAFAGALALTPEQLLAAWPWTTDHTIDGALPVMAERTASDAVIAAIAESLIARASVNFALLTPIVRRLDPAQRRQAAVRLLGMAHGRFDPARSIAGGDGRIDDLMGTAAGAALLAALKAEDSKPAEQSAELLALGLLASQAAARQALDQLAALGLIAVDPRLDMLRLNAELEDRGAP